MKTSKREDFWFDLSGVLELDPDDVEVIKQLCQEADRDTLLQLVEKNAPNTYRWIDKCYHAPSEQEIRVKAVCEAGGWYDVVIVRDDVQTVRFEVMNTGETYASTLCYDIEEDLWFISTLGDLVECCERDTDEWGFGLG